MLKSVVISLPEKEIDKKDTYGINEDITYRSFPEWDKSLMVFVRYGVNHSNDCRYKESPAGSHKRLKSTKKEKIKNCIPGNMSPFLDKHIEEAKEIG